MTPSPSSSITASFTRQNESFIGNLAFGIAVAGFALFAIFLPHSVAGAAIGAAIAILGWLIRSVATRNINLRWTALDWIILLFLLWTAASSLLSEEPDISIAKLQSSWLPLIYCVTRAIVTRRFAVFLVALLILSASAGAIYSLYDLARGRGVVVESLSAASPFVALEIKPGDAIWRLDGKRVYSTAAIDELLRNRPPGTPLVVSAISQGEQIEVPGLVTTGEMQRQTSPSGIIGSRPVHRFRASGWTRHYETFSELLQIAAQLALGLAVANLRRHGFNTRTKLAFATTVIISFGIALTSMRTVLVAFALGCAVIAWRSLKGRAKLLVLAAVLAVLVAGGLMVWNTRAEMALTLSDPSSSLRSQVAKVALTRIGMHPFFGHGMDSMHRHWNEWGFPGKHMLHLHSTPLQIAFDRGLPALALWGWMVVAFWLAAARAEKSARESDDTNRYGMLLGVLGALTGFLASSLVNYNFGDAEVAMAFWWLAGLVVTLRSHQQSFCESGQTTSSQI